MPTYDYRCEKCLTTFDVQAGIPEYERGLKVKCPACGSKRVRRTISTVSIFGSSRDNPRSSSGCCGDARGSSGCCP
jgi:putative FmdB family regulatory protein